MATFTLSHSWSGRDFWIMVVATNKSTQSYNLYNIVTGNHVISYFRSAANRINVFILCHCWVAISR